MSELPVTPPQALDFEPGTVANAEPVPIYTPMRAVRKTCVYCASSPHQIDGCENTTCHLYPLRGGKRVIGVSAIKSMRKRCVECMGGQYVLVPGCSERDCPSWPYRMGTRPGIAEARAERRRAKKDEV